MGLTPQTDRKRDRLRTWFRRPPSPLPGYTTPGSTQPAISTSTNTSIASSILADALEALQSDHRETIRILLQPTNVVSANDAFDEVHAHARELQQRSKIKRWTWTYRGRQIYLFEQADKVLRLLDRFKAVGDIVANVDPVHVGLPWAGVRAILEVALADSNQRAVLVTGIELALYVSNRLKVYLETFASVSPSAARDNLRTSIVSLYAHILEFLAHAIRVQQKGRAATLITALWNLGDLTEFEDKCDRLCVRTAEETRICDSRTSRESQSQTLREIHEFQTGLLRLDAKVDLGKLETAKEATYNSSVEGELPRCLPDTRTDLLKQIFDWATNHAGKRIFWLCGKAGTGKSTISRTVAQKLDDDGLLGASFFFKRGRADRSHARLLFPTIARQLADLFPDLAHLVAAALDRDSLLCDRYIKTQFDSLLLKPLQNVDQDSFSSVGIVLVIDALDECDNSESIKTMLLLLSRVEAITSVRLRIFVTSRPELPVELGFRKMSGDIHHDVRLEEAQEGSIAHDIRVFYENQFSEVRDASSLQVDELPAQWPGEENIRLLVDKAIPLFIFAFTVCRYIAANPQRNLNVLVRESPDGSLPGLKGTYLPILDSVVVSEGDGKAEDRIVDFKLITGTIALLYDPLSASGLARLLNLCIGDVDRVLRPLHSVLNIPRAPDGKMECTTPITLFHLSFRDFLVDSALENESKFWVDAKETHRTLGIHCIRLLESGGLKEDVCGVVAPGTRRSAVAKSKVHSSLPEDVAYACCYWVQHIRSSGDQIKDSDTVLRFLRKHMLHWMEALSWLGKASDVIHNIAALRSFADLDRSKQLLNLLDDASRFTLRNRSIIDEAPLQIYVSALLFSPSLSIIRQTYGDKLRRYFHITPSVPDQWGAERQKLEGHDNSVCAVAFSLDGKTVVSGSGDKTVRLWDTATGEEKQVLKGHNESVNAVAFSPDGKTVASGSGDKTVRLWDAATGEERQKLEGHSDEVCAVAFSQDGKTVVSGSGDKTVRLWDTATGEEKQVLKGHNESVNAVAFSQDSKTVASGSSDETVRLWDAATGEERQKLEGHEREVSVVAFSPDSKTVASGSRDKTVRLWDTAMGEERQVIEGHNDWVSAVAFSPDGKIVASGSYDRTVRLWDAATGEEKQKLEGHDDWVRTMAFSPDGKTVASGSGDKTVRLWDAATGEERQKLEGHDDWVRSVAFSQDGKTVASGSDDKTVRLWDAVTGEERQKLEGHEDWVRAVAFSPDGKTVASGSNDYTVRLWDAATGAKRQKLEGHNDSVCAVAFSADSKTVVSGSDDKTVRLWDAATGEERQKLEGHNDWVRAVAFSLDGKMIASGSSDKKVRLWDAATGEERQKLESHDDEVCTVAFSPDGKIVASGSGDRTVRLWNAATGEERQKLETSRSVSRIAFSIDGNSLETDVGRLDLGTEPPTHRALVTKPQPALLLEASWIKRDNAEFLWLPHEYRGRIHDVQGSRLVIGQVSGAVSLFSFK